MTETASHDPEAFFEALRAEVGRQGARREAHAAAEAADIGTWCAVMGETNPRYSVVDDGPAPPATLNMWTMPIRIGDLGGDRDLSEPQQAVYEMLDAAGFTGVVATNSDQIYNRPIRVGDVVSQQTVLADVSPQKQTALGVGHFVTTEAVYTVDDGTPVGSLMFRVFKFRPGTGRQRDVEDGPAPSPPRPRWNQDQAWHWEGLRDRELRIQRFTDDGRLVHPPVNAHPRTHGMDYDWVVASGRGSLYSFTVPHYPEAPGFRYPHVVGLVELDEGVRLVSNIVGVTAEDVAVGMPLEVCWLDSHDDVTLHQFRPVPPPRTTARPAGTVAVGDRLPPCPVDITAELVSGAALATFDHQDVHHDPEAARAKGMPDIFMSILTSSGLVTRWLGDWAGDDVEFERLEVGLGAPNHPGDTMTFSGEVTAVDDGRVTVGFVGRNGLGAHMTGQAVLVLDGAGG